MALKDKPLLVVVTGPTGSGKTDMAIDLALKYGTEIISADSRQVYRDMPIITAAPTPRQKAMVPHHLVECLDITENYSAARFADDALRIADTLFSRHGVAVVCGGSMMYLDALVNGIDPLPAISPQVRRHVSEIADSQGLPAMLDMLRHLDPEYFETVDRCNPRRVAHALEIIMQSGQKFSDLRTGTRAERPFRVEVRMPQMSRETLFSRINARTTAMEAAGMEDEARRHYAHRHLNALNTVGFKEWFDHFDALNGNYVSPNQLPKGENPARLYPYNRDAVVARIAKNTRLYAKKQLTWLAAHPLDV